VSLAVLIFLLADPLIVFSGEVASTAVFAMGG